MERIRSKERSLRWDAILSFGRTVARVLGWAFAAYCLKESIGALAGKETSAIISSIIKLEADRWVAYTVAALATGGYLIERSSRRKLIRQYGPYIKELETRIDRNRSSSQLTATGEAKKEDLDDA
jgi:hypothetical protein